MATSSYALDQDTLNQFDAQRKRAAQENTAAVQTQKDALKRRFASMGALNSGAALKQDQLTEQQGQENLAKINEGIGAQQIAEGRRQKEIADTRDFSRSEREAGQNFAALQAEAQRKFQTGERLGSQDFARLSADDQRRYMTSERLGSQDFARGERTAGQQFARGERLGSQDFSADQARMARDLQSSQFGQQMDMARLNFDEEKRVNDANIDFNNRMLAQKDMIERLLGNLGFGGLLGEGGGGGVGGLVRGLATGGGALGGVSTFGAIGGGGGGGFF